MLLGLKSILCVVCQLADRWQATCLLTESRRQLVRLETSSFPTVSVYALPQVLRQSTAYEEVMVKAETSLLAAFGNALLVITSPSVLEQFLSLPQQALVALLSSGELRTDTEASVFLLISGWCGEPRNIAICSTQLEELHFLIRYSRLDTLYLSGLCDCHHLPELTRKQIMELWEFSSITSETRWLRGIYKNPEAWYLPRRLVPENYDAQVVLNLAVTLADLNWLLADVGSNVDTNDVSSPTVYSAGFLWRLHMSLDAGELWCTISAMGLASMKSMENGVHIEHGLHRSIRIQVEASQPKVLCDYKGLVHSGGCGISLTKPICEFKDAASLTWWVPYIVDGRVRLTAYVTPVKK